MILHSYRLYSATLKGDPFSGEGARLHGGRWNLPGVPMVYTAATLSLAAMESLVHLHRQSLLGRFLHARVEFDLTLVKTLDHSLLPKWWNVYPAPTELQEIGTRWAQSMVSAILKVPSAVVSTESNYLLNPLHPEYRKIKRESPSTFEFDRRLV